VLRLSLAVKPADVAQWSKVAIAYVPPCGRGQRARIARLAVRRVSHWGGRFMMFALSMPGGAEWIVILIIALLLFGDRLPKVMRSLGKSMSEFKHGMNEPVEEVKTAVTETKPAGVEEKKIEPPKA
jgi:sec-independent protein translocase protein TatA